MGTRLELQTMLETLLGSRNVYYQPPATVKMSYPAIVYSRSNIGNIHANDGVYLQNKVYRLTVIDKNPDSPIVETVSKLPLCTFQQHYTADNLNHDVFLLYF